MDLNRFDIQKIPSIESPNAPVSINPQVILISNDTKAAIDTTIDHDPIVIKADQNFIYEGTADTPIIQSTSQFHNPEALTKTGTFIVGLAVFIYLANLAREKISRAIDKHVDKVVEREEEEIRLAINELTPDLIMFPIDPENRPTRVKIRKGKTTIVRRRS